MKWKVLLSDIDLGEEEIKAVVDVLKSKWLSMGPMTQKFESAFAEYIGVKYAFAVSNGTSALHLAYRAIEIGQGNEVIVPSLTFVATANAILYCGAKPVFADITSYDNLNISPDDILEKITPKTKAICIVHYAGYPCEMKTIMEIAEDYNLKVIEDSAHAIGAEYKGKKCGSFGDVGCFSFFANKNLVTGEGGMVITNDQNVANKIGVMRSHGMTALTWDRYRGHAYSYDVIELGYNYRANEISSAIGLVQLKKLDKNNSKRERIVKEYIKRLKKIPEIIIPFKDYKDESPSYHIFPIILPENISRKDFMDELKKKGIQTSIHYPPIHLFTFYRKTFGFKNGMLPKTEYVGKHEVTLPLHPCMNIEDVRYIVSCVEDALSLLCR